MDTIELIALESVRPGYMVIHILGESGNNQMMVYRPPLKATAIIGVAAREIKQGETIKFCPDGNTEDILVKVSIADGAVYKGDLNLP